MGIETEIAERLARARERLAEYVIAETTILKGAQQYSIGSRTLTRADLQYIKDTIKDLEDEIIKLKDNGRIRLVRVVPRDT